MRTEAQKLARKEYRAANKEKIAAKQKIRMSTYLENNGNGSMLAWQKDNIDKVKIYRKRHKATLKDGLFTVYYLSEENYIGQTNCLYNRMNEHKSKFNRHVLDVEVLGKFETRKEALAFEAKLHSMGYDG